MSSNACLEGFLKGRRDHKFNFPSWLSLFKSELTYRSVQPLLYRRRGSELLVCLVDPGQCHSLQLFLYCILFSAFLAKCINQTAGLEEHRPTHQIIID